jgi:hypothetical protein
MEELVLQFFSSAESEAGQVALESADFIFYGNRERQLGEFNPSPGMQLVFDSGEVAIYSIR